MNTIDVQALLNLDVQVKDLRGQLKEAETRRDEAEKLLVDAFVEEGISSMNLDGKTVYLHQQMWASKAKDADGLAANEVLRQSGFADCLMFGTQKLSAYVREAGEDEFFAAHPELRDVVSTEMRISLRVRAS